MRRVKRLNPQAAAQGPGQGELFATYRYHALFTVDSTETTVAADITHRRHAIIETVFADLTDGALAHLPSGRFAANGAWRSVPPSPTTCSAPPAPSPETGMPSPAPRPFVARSSPSPRGWPGRNATGCCTCPRIGPGRTRGRNSLFATGPQAAAA